MRYNLPPHKMPLTPCRLRPLLDSNGGRFLDRYDTCVRTLFTSGGFDLSTCTYSRQCTSGTCYEGRCSPTGSLRLEINVAGQSFAIQGSELIRSNAVDEDGRRCHHATRQRLENIWKYSTNLQNVSVYQSLSYTYIERYQCQQIYKAAVHCGSL
jgi:hypothetical protein